MCCQGIQVVATMLLDTSARAEPCTLTVVNKESGKLYIDSQKHRDEAHEVLLLWRAYKLSPNVQAYKRAASQEPEFWQYQYGLAKALSKQAAPAGQILHHFAKACHLAQCFVGARLEPLYCLHALRLKLLIKVPPGRTT